MAFRECACRSSYGTLSLNKKITLGAAKLVNGLVRVSDDRATGLLRGEKWKERAGEKPSSVLKLIDEDYRKPARYETDYLWSMVSTQNTSRQVLTVGVR